MKTNGIRGYFNYYYHIGSQSISKIWGSTHHIISFIKGKFWKAETNNSHEILNKTNNYSSSTENKLQEFYCLKQYKAILNIQVTQHNYENHNSWSKERLLVNKEIIEKEIHYMKEVLTNLEKVKVMDEFTTELSCLKTQYQSHIITLDMKRTRFIVLIDTFNNEENAEANYIDKNNTLQAEVYTLKTQLATADLAIIDLKNKVTNLSDKSNENQKMIATMDIKNKNAYEKIKELEEENRALESAKTQLEINIKQNIKLINQSNREINSSENDQINLKNDFKKKITELNEIVRKKQYDIDLLVIQNEELEKNLNTRNETLKRTQTELDDLKKVQDNKKIQMENLNETINELKLKLDKNYNYIQKLICESSLIIKDPAQMPKYHQAIETIYKNLKENAVSVHLQLNSFMEFRREQKEIDENLMVIHQQIVKQREEVIKLTMMMQAPSLDNENRSNNELAAERQRINKNLEMLREKEQTLFHKNSVCSNLEEQQTFAVQNHFQELINYLEEDIKGLEKYLLTIDAVKKMINDYTDISTIKPSTLGDNLIKATRATYNSTKKQNPKGNKTKDIVDEFLNNVKTSPSKQSSETVNTTFTSSPKEKQLSPKDSDSVKRKLKPMSTNNKSKEKEQLTEKTFAASESEGMVNSTFIVTPATTTLSQQMVPQLPTVPSASQSNKHPALEVD